ncbi:MAG TPA: hypothetical protein VFS21_17840 [Roseiflexaceae bacterium]|nr:hypothetical protein [Roseiflexaceae bacterium]
MEPPFILRHHGRRIGTVVSYGYATPWAGGRLLPDDPAERDRLARVCAFLNALEDMPDDQSDADYAAALRDHRLTEADLDGYWDGWTMTLPDGETRSINALLFDETEFIEWRW